MYAFVRLKGDAGRAFEAWCKRQDKDPGVIIESMIEGFVRAGNHPTPPKDDMGEGMEKLVSTYVKIRDTKSQLKRLFEAEEAQLKDAMDKIGSVLLDKLNTEKVKSMATTVGTFYREKILKPSVADWPAFYAYIRKHDAFHLLERRVTKTGVEDYMAEHESLPPGTQAIYEYEVRVRRGKDN